MITIAVENSQSHDQELKPSRETRPTPTKKNTRSMKRAIMNIIVNRNRLNYLTNLSPSRAVLLQTFSLGTIRHLVMEIFEVKLFAQTFTCVLSGL